MSECDGCIELGSDTSCTIKKVRKERQCPCRICLVKMICKKACSLWEKLHEESFYIRGERKEKEPWQKVDVG